MNKWTIEAHEDHCDKFHVIRKEEGHLNYATWRGEEAAQSVADKLNAAESLTDEDRAVISRAEQTRKENEAMQFGSRAVLPTWTLIGKLLAIIDRLTANR